MSLILLMMIIALIGLGLTIIFILIGGYFLMKSIKYKEGEGK